MVYLHLNILHLYSVCKLRYIVTFCDLFYSSSPYVWLLGWTVFHCSVCCVPDFVFSAAFYWKSVFFSGNGESLSLRSTCMLFQSDFQSVCWLVTCKTWCFGFLWNYLHWQRRNIQTNWPTSFKVIFVGFY